MLATVGSRLVQVFSCWPSFVKAVYGLISLFHAWSIQIYADQWWFKLTSAILIHLNLIQTNPR
jgi:hypothetical protein